MVMTVSMVLLAMIRTAVELLLAIIAAAMVVVAGTGEAASA